MPITRDADRLAAVAAELGAAVRETQMGARVHLPVLQPRDAAGLVLAMTVELDDAIAERAAAATEAGHHIACGAGCASCCESPVVVTEDEAVAVAEWLTEPGNEAARTRFLARYGAWRAAVGSSLDELRAADNPAAQRTAGMTYLRKGVMCAFNTGGLCEVYPARPSRCRTAHALETNAHCGSTGDGQVQYFQHVRTEETFREQEAFHGVLHHALRGTSVELLCEAVHRRLGVEVGRNDLCPCGSGKKYKKCHGA